MKAFSPLAVIIAALLLQAVSLLPLSELLLSAPKPRRILAASAPR